MEAGEYIHKDALKITDLPVSALFDRHEITVYQVASEKCTILPLAENLTREVARLKHSFAVER